MSQRRVAITGIGMISPLGHDTESTWQALKAGQSGLGQISHFDAHAMSSTIAAEVKNFDPNTVIKDKKILKYTVSFTQYALCAATQAFEDAGIRPTETSAERWGAVAGSGMMTAEFEYWERFQKSFAKKGKLDTDTLGRAAHHFYRTSDFGKTQANSGLALLLQHFNIRGYANSVHTACASGGQALGLAMQAIRRGDADYMLAGGFDSMINPIGVASFCLLGALSTYNDNPQTASRPFDKTRNGFVLGEGAAFLILEDLEKAQARGAKIYAELAGEGNSVSAYRITDSHPSGDGAIQAIEGALGDAGIAPQSVDYINGHGTSTKMNDLSESNAIKAVFGDHTPYVSSTKSMTGHLIAAAGALEGAISALCIANNTIPPNANYTTPDPECDLNIATSVKAQNISTVLSNSFGFGGSNSCLVLREVQS